MRPMASHDRWALLESDKHRVSTFVSQLLNLVTRMTPFDEPTDRLFTKMHDIAHYLSAMTQSEGAPLIE
ncbi:MAG: hypothetical protein KVP17_001752 [Porospora cf. gigantea B]|nr:MAG: hypothetical protein KVP17_001752 [Porospora cf. gigantea B]